MPRDELGAAAAAPAIPRNWPGSEALAQLLRLADVHIILDVGSGTGAHATVMRGQGRQVDTISLCEPADYVGDFLSWPSAKTDYDALWLCHVLEHQADPGVFLRACKARLRPGGYLAVTVPPAKNAIVGGHVTLWNAGLLLYHLILAGFDCRNARVGTYGYNISVIVPNVDAALPALLCDHGDLELLAPFFPFPIRQGFDGQLPNIGWGDTIARPDHVAIVAFGDTAESYMNRAKLLGNRYAFADQIWGINAVGSILCCDLVFHMDDVRIQEIRAKARPDSNIAASLRWLKTYDGPVMTSRAHPDYPCLVEFPLEAVLNRFGWGYFNNTVAYAIAYAGYLGVKEISPFGCDFTYPRAHKAEKGRACVEWWLGFLAGGGGAAPGIGINLPARTPLMDSIDERGEDDAVFYGYDTVKVAVSKDGNGQFKVTMNERETLPTAEEIEAAYDHGQPPVMQGIKR